MPTARSVQQLATSVPPTTSASSSTPYTSFLNIIRTLVVISVLTPLVLPLVPYAVELDVCYIDRRVVRQAATWPYALAGMLISLGLILAIKVVGLGANQHEQYTSLQAKTLRSHRWRYSGFILFSYLWYLHAYFLCNTLKQLLADYACNTHSNSVSGHYLFFIYTTFTLLHIHLHQLGLLRAPLHSLSTWKKLLYGSRENIAFAVFYVVFLINASLIMYDTYIGGYHTLRQILYGTALAFLTQYVLVETIEFIDWLDQPVDIKLTTEPTPAVQQFVADELPANSKYALRSRSRTPRKPTAQPTTSDAVVSEKDQHVEQTNGNSQQGHSQQTGAPACIIHTSAGGRGYFQRGLFYLALFPHTSTRDEQFADLNQLDDSDSTPAPTTSDVHCGSYVAKRAWRVVLIIAFVLTVLAFIALNLTADTNIGTAAAAYKTYSISDVLVCVAGWVAITYMHYNDFLVAQDACTVHDFERPQARQQSNGHSETELTFTSQQRSHSPMHTLIHGNKPQYMYRS